MRAQVIESIAESSFSSFQNYGNFLCAYVPMLASGEFLADPAYFNYTYCRCTNNSFGVVNSQAGCQQCLEGGICDGGAAISWPVDWYPIFADPSNMNSSTAVLLGFEECESHHVCNPTGACQFTPGVGFNQIEQCVCATGYDRQSPLCYRCQYDGDVCYFPGVEFTCQPNQVWAMFLVLAVVVAFLVVFTVIFTTRNRYLPLGELVLSLVFILMGLGESSTFALVVCIVQALALLGSSCCIVDWRCWAVAAASLLWWLLIQSTCAACVDSFRSLP
jgi:hypothetical protein